jgi:hypothetical protein
MAARTNKLTHDEKTKNLIRASQLLNRLTAHANGEIELTQSQIQAARIVIAKAIPDMRSVEITGEDGGPLVVECVKFAG